MQESLRIFTSRFEGLKLRPGQRKWGESFAERGSGEQLTKRSSGYQIRHAQSIIRE